MGGNNFQFPRFSSNFSGRKKKSTRFSPGEEEEEGKVWSAAAWFLPMTSHQQQQFDTKSPPSILDSQVDQK